MRKQYHFWPGDNGSDAWDVDRLIELSRGLPIEPVAVDSNVGSQGDGLGEHIAGDTWFDVPRGNEVHGRA